MQRKKVGSNFIQWGLLLMILLSSFLLTGCDQQKQAEKIMLSTELPGRTSAFRVAEIRPQVSGLIQKRLFTEGANVKAGQILYQIDPASLEAALDNATATVVAAQKNADRARAALRASIANVTRQKESPLHWRSRIVSVLKMPTKVGRFQQPNVTRP